MCQIAIESVAFVTALRACLPCASKDETRPHMNSVHLKLLADGAVDMVTTDGHRLAIYRFAASRVDRTGEGPFDVLVSVEDANAWVKLASKEKAGHTTIDPTGTIATLHTGRSLAFRPVAAQFPPYAQVLPNVSAPHVAAVNPQYLMEAAAAFGLLARAFKRVSVGIYVRGEGELDPCAVTSPAFPEFAIVVMPMRTDKIAPSPLAKSFAVPAEPTAKKVA